MANPPHKPQQGGLSLRLRALRREHPTLAVLTEIIQLDEQRVTFRATVRIDGETRAQGHAAQGADPAGNFVATAERLAVEQALLLGGFDTAEDTSPVSAITQTEPERQPVTTADNPTPPTTRHRRRRDHSAQASIPPHVDGDAERSADLAASTAPLPPNAVTDAIEAGQPFTPATPPPDTDTTAGATSAPASQTEPPPATRRKRDQRTEPKRARSRRSDSAGEDLGAVRARRGDAIVPNAEAEPLVPEQSPLPAEETSPPAPQPPPSKGRTSEKAPDAPESPTKSRRRARSRTSAAPQAAPAPEAQGTRESVRAAWQVGRPIPAWWPPDRIAVEKPLPKAQVERLRAMAITEEITPAQLDAYSTMLFGSVVADLNQAQGAILEERLNSAYPSPLQELSSRRLLHPIAVGDTVTTPDDHPVFIRWRDVPPVEEPPEPPPPVTPTWRKKRVAKRRRR